MCVLCSDSTRGMSGQCSYWTRVIRVRVLSELVTWQNCRINGRMKKSSTLLFFSFLFHFFFLPRQQAESRLIGAHGAENTNGSCPPWDQGLPLTTVIIDSSFHLLMLSEAKMEPLYLFVFSHVSFIADLHCTTYGAYDLRMISLFISFSPFFST